MRYDSGESSNFRAWEVTCFVSRVEVDFSKFFE